MTDVSNLIFRGITLIALVFSPSLLQAKNLTFTNCELAFESQVNSPIQHGSYSSQIGAVNVIGISVPLIPGVDSIGTYRALAYPHTYKMSGKIAVQDEFGGVQWVFKRSDYRPQPWNYEFSIDNRSTSPGTWLAVQMLPDFFKPLGFGADLNHLTLPDSQRLNAIRTGNSELNLNPRYAKLKALVSRAQFRDLAKLRPQEFSSIELIEDLAEGRVPLAARGRWMFHDRFEEHLLGALFMPPELFKRFVLIAQALKAALDLNYGRFSGSRNMTLKSELKAFVSSWDGITSEIGYTVLELSIENQKLTMPGRPIVLGPQLKPFSKISGFGLIISHLQAGLKSVSPQSRLQSLQDRLQYAELSQKGWLDLENSIARYFADLDSVMISLR